MSRPVAAEPKPGKKLSLTLLLMALVTLVFLLTTTILLIGSYQSKKKSLIETTLNLNYANAARMSKTVDSLFRSMRSSLLFSADQIANLRDVSPDSIDAYLDLTRNSSNYFNSIILVNANGTVLNNSPAELGMVGRQITSFKSRKRSARRILTCPHRILRHQPAECCFL